MFLDSWTMLKKTVLTFVEDDALSRGAVSEVQRKAGECYQRPAGIEHAVMNGSEHPMAFIEIEIKRPDELARAK
jgi:hypothetical protein